MVIGLGVPECVGVHERAPAAAVEGAEVAAPEVLAAVGLHAVDMEIVEEVAALREPPRPRRRVRDVEHERIGEPPAGVAIGRAVVVQDAVAAVDHDLLVEIVLRVRGV